MITPLQISALYDQGGNVMENLRKEFGVRYNSSEIIEISYDMQAGSYISALDDPQYSDYMEKYTQEIAKTIISLVHPSSVLEAGVGEATTFSGVLKHLGVQVQSYGFDLSWSRVAFAKKWLEAKGYHDSVLCSGDLFHIPFADNSIDVVYTSHSIEPNGGREEPILRELYRVARQYLILLEPGYELADQEARERMDRLGYCRNIRKIAVSNGYDVIAHEFFPVTSNRLNPTAMTIIRKKETSDLPLHTLSCPKFKTPLIEIGNMLFSQEALVAYPIMGGIPCLRIENGIFASKYRHVMEDGRSLNEAGIVVKPHFPI